MEKEELVQRFNQFFYIVKNLDIPKYVVGDTLRLNHPILMEVL